MKKRYLIGQRQGAVVSPTADAAVEALIGNAENVKHVRKLATGHRVVEMDEEAAQKLAAEHPELLVEEDPELELFPMPGLPPVIPSAAGRDLRVEVTDTNTGDPLANVTIFAVGRQIVYRGLTGGDGVAVVNVNEADLQRVVASPANGYWSQFSGAMTVGDEPVRFKLKPLTINGAYDWGPLALGVDTVAEEFTGRGVKVAIIDSGVAAHEDLHPTGGFNTLDGQDTNAWNVDENGHGTHCSGIAAALLNDVGIRGVAPGADVYMVKVFPGGRFSDLIEAVNWCVENYIDVISMSLGSSSYSQVLEQTIQEAVGRGIVCVAAAGNEGGPVSYPAAFDSVIAVSAIGKLGSFPDDSAHALRFSQYMSADGQYFAASFTNFGAEVEVCAPGVAILSSVPGGYAAWDGTSMACPAIAGFVALILEAYPSLRTGDGWTAYQVRSVLRSSSIDMGLPPQIQGAGLPNAAVALGDALQNKAAEQQDASYYRSYLEGMLEHSRQVTKSIEDALGSLAS